MAVLKQHYITKIVNELLVGNSRFLIQDLLNQLLCYENIKESCLFVTEIVGVLDPNNWGMSNGLATVFSRQDRL